MNIREKPQNIVPQSVTCGPLPGSKKIYHHPEGRPDIAVPFREIALDPTCGGLADDARSRGCLDPAWSPDCSQIAFSSTRRDGIPRRQLGGRRAVVEHEQMTVEERVEAVGHPLDRPLLVRDADADGRARRPPVRLLDHLDSRSAACVRLPPN